MCRMKSRIVVKESFCGSHSGRVTLLSTLFNVGYSKLVGEIILIVGLPRRGKVDIT